MRYSTYQTTATDLTHSEVVALAREAAGEGEWSVYSIDWYTGAGDYAVVELICHDEPGEDVDK